MFDVPSLLESFSYLAILALLLSASLGAPVPEEVVVTSAGLFAARGVLDLHLAAPVCFAGVLAADAILYLVGARLGRRAVEHRLFKRVLGGRFAGWIEARFSAHGLWMVVLARQVVGMRAPTFLLAGIARLPFRRFILADAAAALISVPAMLLVGHRFGAHLPQLLAALEQVRGWIGLAVAVAAVTGVAVALLRRRRRGAVLPPA